MNKPFQWNDASGLVRDGQQVHQLVSMGPMTRRNQDGKRLVACYNACLGLNPEAIAGAVRVLAEIAAHYYSQQDASCCRDLAKEALINLKQKGDE